MGFGGVGVEVKCFDFVSLENELAVVGFKLLCWFSWRKGELLSKTYLFEGNSDLHNALAIPW